MKLKLLKAQLAELGPEHDEKEVWLQGCDCQGACGGLVLTDEPIWAVDPPEGSVLLQREDRGH